ncbi:MAG: MarR family transcriptional regulator [Actinomycetota bacterium]
MSGDHVDRIIEQWRRERPDLDVTPMEVVGRVSRLDRLLRPHLRATFTRFGLEDWEFDMLATLRRHEAPHRLSAGALLDSMMVSSGAMTNRIDRLQARGLVQRERDPEDARVVLVSLTEQGLALVDEALDAHVAKEARLVSALDDHQRARLASLLRALHLAVEELGDPPAADGSSSAR